MKKSFVFILFLSVITIRLSAQTDKCATMHVFNEHLKENPALWNKLHGENPNRWASSSGPANFQVKGRLMTIPVVFHVVYYEGDSVVQNIPDSVLLSQLEVLNEDYRRANADTVNTRDVFKPMAADVGIEFVLATVDPNGNPTTGINRKKTSTNGFNPLTGFDKMKATATGGVDPWPRDEYLNIWICDMSFFGQVFVLGYAQFPGDNAATDGVVFQFQHVGRNNSLGTAPANLGRTASHEVGHWLGLRHIWGDGPCDSTDYVYDTPKAADKSQSDCDKSKNTCVDFPVDNPDMVENYMDYSADACMNTFTNGQAQRMWSMISQFRTGLLSSTKHGGNYINILPDIKGVTCPNSNDGEISITAYGGTAPYTYLWAHNSTSSSISGLSEGEYTLTVTDSLNNTNTVTFILTATQALAGISTPTNATCDTCANGSATVSLANENGNITYLWNTIPSQNQLTATDLAPGTYTVTVTDDCDTIVLTSIIEVTPTVGISNSISNLDQIKIYPNPTTGNLNFEMNTSSIKDFQLTIYNILGESIETKAERKSTGGNYFVDMSNHTNGIYIIEIKAENQVIRKKVTLNK